MAEKAGWLIRAIPESPAMLLSNLSKVKPFGTSIWELAPTQMTKSSF
jgi:hypothetical protein